MHGMLSPVSLSQESIVGESTSAHFRGCSCDVVDLILLELK